MFLNVLSSAGGAASGFSSIFFLIIIFVVFYFFMIRPENKRKKQLNEMRDHTAVGDEIVTIGGIMGKVVQVTGDTITFETGEDRVRMQVTKWAISTNVREEKQRAAAQAAARNARVNKKKAKTSGEENSIVDDDPTYGSAPSSISHLGPRLVRGCANILT